VSPRQRVSSGDNNDDIEFIERYEDDDNDDDDADSEYSVDVSRTNGVVMKSNSVKSNSHKENVVATTTVATSAATASAAGGKKSKSTNIVSIVGGGSVGGSQTSSVVKDTLIPRLVCGLCRMHCSDPHVTGTDAIKF